MSPPGRPEGESASAQHEESPVTRPRRPEREFLSAQHETPPMSPACQAGRGARPSSESEQVAI